MRHMQRQILCILVGILLVSPCGGSLLAAPEDDVSQTITANTELRIARALAGDDSVPAGVRTRAQKAVAEWSHTDQPLLVRAMLYNNPITTDGRPMLHAIVLDRNFDLCGIRVREEHRTTDGTPPTIEEDYPVYARYVRAPGTTWVDSARYVSIRDNNQRKDQLRWERYLLDSIDWIIHRYVLDKRTPRGYEVSMPAVWISAPEPNAVCVQLSVYDRAGHESQYIEVENLLGSEHRATAIDYMAFYLAPRP